MHTLVERGEHEHDYDRSEEHLGRESCHPLGIMDASRTCHEVDGGHEEAEVNAIEQRLSELGGQYITPVCMEANSLPPPQLQRGDRLE